MPRSGKNRKVLSNDDSWILHFRNPVTPEIMWDEMIEPHVGSAIDGFIWSSGAYTYNFETEIAERSDSRSPGNLEQFIEKHGGPLTVIPKLCRKPRLASWLNRFQIIRGLTLRNTNNLKSKWLEIKHID